jgi:hypothetical protein
MHHQGLPKAFRPLRLAAGELRYGVPELDVEIPPGSWYDPGPGEGSLRSSFGATFLFF